MNPSPDETGVRPGGLRLAFEDEMRRLRGHPEGAAPHQPAQDREVARLREELRAVQNKADALRGQLAVARAQLSYTRLTLARTLDSLLALDQEGGR
jgi:hypothetical protein